VNELVKRELTGPSTLELFDTIKQARNAAVDTWRGAKSPEEAVDCGEHVNNLTAKLSFALGQLEAMNKRKLETPRHASYVLDVVLRRTAAAHVSLRQLIKKLQFLNQFPGSAQARIMTDYGMGIVKWRADGHPSPHNGQDSRHYQASVRARFRHMQWSKTSVDIAGSTRHRL
jgi:hypothetical protein